jgi:hypothetical protein
MQYSLRATQLYGVLIAGFAICLLTGQKGDASAAETSGPAPLSTAFPTDDGYRGIWYMNQPSKDEYKYKYSGGFATYPQQHAPIAIYSKEANKTFFCYGGTTTTGPRQLLHMVSSFDHATSTVPRPTILLNKKTDDAHDNPVLSLDDQGYIWIFSPSHGTGRPTFLHKSTKPYDISSFVSKSIDNYSYPQPWHIPGKGFLFLHTRYQKGRSLFWMTSPDGEAWSKPENLSYFGQGHYQISWPQGQRLGTAFNFHPAPLGLNARTNLYYVETTDMGKTWLTAGGIKLDTPIVTTQSQSLIRNYQAEGKLVYLKDLNYDHDGNPVIMYLTSSGFESGPKNDPRTWHTAHWTGNAWDIRPITTSDSNYDFGSLYIEPGIWRMIGATAPGPQPYNPGGEIQMWVSTDQGTSWTMTKQLTKDSTMNHTYPRRPYNAHPDFYALWADGHARQPSESSLYFTNRDGSHVWRLPTKMNADSQAPEIVEP